MFVARSVTGFQILCKLGFKTCLNMPEKKKHACENRVVIETSNCCQVNFRKSHQVWWRSVPPPPPPPPRPSRVVYFKGHSVKTYMVLSMIILQPKGTMYNKDITDHRPKDTTIGNRICRKTGWSFIKIRSSLA